jgi:hypothetical protein
MWGWRGTGAFSHNRGNNPCVDAGDSFVGECFRTVLQAESGKAIALALAHKERIDLLMTEW